MKLFKSPNGLVFAYEPDGSQDELIPQDYVQITQEEADALIAIKEQEAFNALSYSEKRQREYPPITNYIDGVVKGDQAQIDKYIADCLAVKAKYPKPETS